MDLIKEFVLRRNIQIKNTFNTLLNNKTSFAVTTALPGDQFVTRANEVWKYFLSLASADRLSEDENQIVHVYSFTCSTNKIINIYLFFLLRCRTVFFSKSFPIHYNIQIHF